MAKKPVVHLICNAHLDPVWLWQWPEGAAEAISTFRVAADFCEEYGDFVFNHNEVILYQWVKEYEPALFERIQRLVKAGKWHIMGGWYLQPDCNMPSGESFVRQIQEGKAYFKEHFGVEPTTAINFDPFGHTRGLVQIMAKSGYDSYLFGRPREEECPLRVDDFVWEGYDGSEVMAARFSGWYNSALGKAQETIVGRLDLVGGRPSPFILWGVGNHGGGPSRQDIEDIERWRATFEDYDVRHSTPEAIFKVMKTKRDSLPRWKEDINPWAVGCYSSQIRIKQKHRLLENAYYMTEKMAVTAAEQQLMGYPVEELREALGTLLKTEFHDILPGSSIQPAEEDALDEIAHGLHLLTRARVRSFFALASGQKKAKDGEIPILVYNPHPYPIRTQVECEFQLADQNYDGSFTQIHVREGKKLLPTQVEKEYSNLPIDWRKRVVFEAELAPSSMNRFDCELKVLEAKPERKLAEKNGKISFKNDSLDVVINTETGLMDRYRVDGVDMTAKGALAGVVMRDDEDPWGMLTDRFNDEIGRFKLMTTKQSTWYAGLEDKKATLKAVRVIEDGPVRSVVEAVFIYHQSFMCMRYKLPKQGTEIEIELRVHWNEKDRMLKLEIPAAWKESEYWGQVAYGKQQFTTDGGEKVAQKWTALCDCKGGTVLSCVNDGTYSSDCMGNVLRQTLLRSPAYSAHPIEERQILPYDRFMERSDQGERVFRYWLNGGNAAKRWGALDREALTHNEKPMALSFFPSGDGVKVKDGVCLEGGGEGVLMTTLKSAAKGNDVIMRLYESTGRKRKVKVKMPMLGKSMTVELGGFEIKTYKINPRTKQVVETDLLERKLRKK